MRQQRFLCINSIRVFYLKKFLCDVHKFVNKLYNRFPFGDIPNSLPIRSVCYTTSKVVVMSKSH